MADHLLTITGIKPDGALILNNDPNWNGVLDVKTNDTVTWAIGSGSGVQSIDAIFPDAGNTSVFSSDPAPVAGTTSWRGTIESSTAQNDNEWYSITYTNTSGVQHTWDPDIQVNP